MAENIGLFAKMRIFYGEVRTEMSKVVWPTQEELKTYTIVVMVATAILAILTGIWDLFLSQIMRFFYGI